MFRVVFKNHNGNTVYELTKKFDNEDEAWDAAEEEMNEWSSKKQESLTPSVEEN